MCDVTWRGDFSKKRKPAWLAPDAITASIVSSVESPHILIFKPIIGAKRAFVKLVNAIRMYNSIEMTRWPRTSQHIQAPSMCPAKVETLSAPSSARNVRHA